MLRITTFLGVWNHIPLKSRDLKSIEPLCNPLKCIEMSLVFGPQPFVQLKKWTCHKGTQEVPNLELVANMHVNILIQLSMLLYNIIHILIDSC